MVESHDHVSIDLKKLADSITVARENLDSLTGDCCIYEVPPNIRMANESLYTPKVVSIGPLHYGRKELEAMEEHKLRYLNQFLQRTRVSTLDFLEFIKCKEVALRDCYADTIKYGSESFVKIIFLDAIFLIEIFLRSKERTSQIVDRVFSNPGKVKVIVFDIMLLENQIPMFILRELFEFAKLKEPLSSFACDFLTHFVCRDVLIDTTSMREHFSVAKHFVDLVRLCLQPPKHDVNKTQPQTDSSNVGTKRQGDRETAPNVTNLHRCGITLKPAPTDNLLDIKFKKGILEIPKLTITSMTIHLLRNLHVFELLHCNTNFINDYHILLHRLLNTPKDVELLIQAKVIENRVLDNEGVSTLFQELSRDARVDFGHFNYSGLVKDLQGYTRSKRHQWTAILGQKYCSNPWVSISVIAASMILILTLIQTVCSVIGLRQ